MSKVWVRGEFVLEVPEETSEIARGVVNRCKPVVRDGRWIPSGGVGNSDRAEDEYPEDHADLTSFIFDRLVVEYIDELGLEVIESAVRAQIVDPRFSILGDDS